MRTSLLLIPVLLGFGLACTGRLGDARDRSCDVACHEAEAHCVERCAKDAGEGMCEAACAKGRDVCVEKCQK